jgi:hypothetical protein
MGRDKMQKIEILRSKQMTNSSQFWKWNTDVNLATWGKKSTDLRFTVEALSKDGHITCVWPILLLRQVNHFGVCQTDCTLFSLSDLLHVNYLSA